jgi:hypothetical protein
LRDGRRRRKSFAVKEPTKIAAREAREQRLRAALRENLKRRKAQVRGRDEARDEPRTVPEGPAGEGAKSGS